MKGITPIISIIILLLITIGMAAAAWTYLSGYMDTLIGKSMVVSAPSCVTSGSVQKVVGIIQNLGENQIRVGEVLVLDSETGLATANTVAWTDIGGTTVATSIDPGTYVQLAIECCNISVGLNQCPRRCTFRLMLAGRSTDLSHSCTG